MTYLGLKFMSSSNWQVLKALLDVSWMHAWAYEVHSRIIQMECNLLYCLPAASVGRVTPSSKPKLDMDQISLLGGIEIICNEVGSEPWLVTGIWYKKAVIMISSNY
jgi:hypothetical protein